MVEIRIGDDEVERLLRAIRGDPVGDFPATAFQPHRLDRSIQTYGPTRGLKEADERPHQCPRPPPRKEDAPLALQVVDERVDGACVEGISADEQRVKAQRLPQVLVLHEARHRRVDGAVRPQLHQLGRDFNHVRETQKGDAGKLFIAFSEDPTGIVHKRAVAGHVARVALHNLRFHLG